MICNHSPKSIMKPHLPTILLAAVLACISQPVIATETINLNTHDWDQYVGKTPEFDNVNLSLDGNWSVNLDKFYGPCWGSTDNGSYTLTGQGTMDFKNDNFIICGGSSDWPDSANPPTGNAQYTISSGIVLKNVSLDAQLGAQVKFNGSLETSSKESSCSFFVDSTVDGPLSIIDLRNATIKDNDFVNLEFCRGTIIKDQYTVSTTHGLKIWNYTSFEGSGILQGNLILSDGGEVALLDYGRNKYSNITVTGTLSITGNTTIDFHCIGPEDSFLSPETGTIVFYCKDITGETSLLKITESYDGTTTVSRDIADKKFVSIAQTDGRYALTLVDNDYNPGQPEQPGTIITDGKAPDILSQDVVVSLANGGNVDATKVTSGLSNAYVQGTGGTLVTSSSQTFTMSGSDTLGFNMVGTDGNAGADIQVGQAGGSITDAAIVLTGDEYESNRINVQSGLLEIGQNTVLGTTDSVLTVGTPNGSEDAVTASVNNRGTINNDVAINSGASLDNRNTINGDVLVNGSSILSNNGVVKGIVTVSENGSVNGSGTFGSTILQSNALLYVGNSPGFQKHNNLTLNNGSRLGFYLDGITAATSSNHGSGTYSNLSVTNSLAVNGTVNTEVEVGLGILAAGTEAFTLNLIKANGTGSVNGNFALSLNDKHHLLK